MEVLLLIYTSPQWIIVSELHWWCLSFSTNACASPINKCTQRWQNLLWSATLWRKTRIIISQLINSEFIIGQSLLNLIPGIQPRTTVYICLDFFSHHWVTRVIICSNMGNIVKPAILCNHSITALVIPTWSEIIMKKMSKNKIKSKQR